MFKKCGYQVVRRCIPFEKHGAILTKYHSSPYGGHFVLEKSLKTIALNTYCTSLITFKGIFINLVFIR